jgi:peroxiredoxin
MRLPESRHLPWLLLPVLAALGFLLWMFGLLGTARLAPGATRAADHIRLTHYVSPRQVADVNAMVHQKVTIEHAMDQEGRTLSWNDLSGGQPVVLVFLKEGCPCNQEFEPFFQRVERLYHGAVRFAAVIDADTSCAARYASELHVPYTVLADPGHDIIRRCRAENGGYTVLLSAEGRIDGSWPGCSAETLRALGHSIARMAGVPERSLNVSDLSDALTTGCPYES